MDDREVASGFAAAVVTRCPWARIGRVDVGDVRIGARTALERKTLPDFLASLRDGRLFRQAYALGAVANRPCLLLEGTDPCEVSGLRPESFRGVLLSLTFGFRIPVLRTEDLAESASFVAWIARYEARRLLRGARPAAPTPGRLSLDVLAAIPGVGDYRARRLIEQFGSVAGIAQASESELRQVRSVGQEIARAILAALAVGCRSSERL